MSNELNLDINSYNNKELFQLLNISNESNEKAIENSYNFKINKINNIPDIDLKEKLKIFFNKIYNKLLTIVQNKEKTTKSNKVFKSLSNTFENISSEDITKLTHPVPEINNPKINSIFNIKYPTGLINPIEKKITSEILCLDSVFRDSVKYPESNDFVYELPNPIENVINMKLLSAELPDIQETFSTLNNNNCIEITMFNGYFNKDGSLNEMPPEGVTIKIIIPDGHPPDNILRETIQNQLDSRRDSFSFLHIDYDEYKYTLYFRYKTLIECINWNNSYNINLDLNQRMKFPTDNEPGTSTFRMPSTTFTGLVATGAAYEDLKTIYLGTKNYTKNTDLTDGFMTPPHSSGDALSYTINFNPNSLPLKDSPGWKLGFRFNEINKVSNLKNSTTHNEIYGNQIQNKNYSYEKKCKLFESDLTKNRYNILYYGYISATTPYVGITNAYYFLYVNDFVGNYNDTLNVAQNKNIFAKSLLAKLQLSNSTFTTKFIQSNATSVLEKTREYFGPVTIKKLHIKLLDKYNKVIDTKKADFSISLQFEKLYSSVSN